MRRKSMRLAGVLMTIGISGCAASCAKVAAVAVESRLAEAKREAAALDIKMFDDGLGLFKLRHGHYPTTAQGLTVFLKGQMTRDPWGHDYVYRRPGKLHPDSYDVTSFGADGRPGGERDDADIVNNEADVVK
ncbi:MAG: type II secretion system protein GspG [Candidatus Dormibacteraceae bacterium]